MTPPPATALLKPPSFAAPAPAWLPMSGGIIEPGDHLGARALRVCFDSGALPLLAVLVRTDVGG
jgi:hypothetical protein